MFYAMLNNSLSVYVNVTKNTAKCVCVINDNVDCKSEKASDALLKMSICNTLEENRRIRLFQFPLLYSINVVSLVIVSVVAQISYAYWNHSIRNLMLV
jgi:hypothetical protein